MSCLLQRNVLAKRAKVVNKRQAATKLQLGNLDLRANFLRDPRRTLIVAAHLDNPNF